jgi:DHA1 family tetracycline resistance protein-like MFS transporter
MADISRPEDKAKNFGLVGAAFGVGFVLGPLIGGFLGELGTRAPFYAAAILAGVNAVLGYYVLKETVDDSIRRPFSLARANPLGSLRVLGRMPIVGRLIGVFFIYQCAFMVYPAIWSYFGNARFGWSPFMIGLSLMLFGVMLAIVQGGLIRLVLGWLGERGTVTYGHAFDVVAFLLLAFVTNGTIALVLTPLAALAGVITPALQGLMSKRVGDDQQGELQGALTSASAVASILGFGIYPIIFAGFTGLSDLPYMPGAPFLLSALLIGLGLFVFRRIRFDAD